MVKRICPTPTPLPDEAVLFIQVHDELVIDCPSELVDQTKKS